MTDTNPNLTLPIPYRVTATARGYPLPETLNWSSFVVRANKQTAPPSTQVLKTSPLPKISHIEQ